MVLWKREGGREVMRIQPVTQASHLYMSKQLQVTSSDLSLLPPSPVEVVWMQGHKHRPPNTCVKDRKFYPGTLQLAQSPHRCTIIYIGSHTNSCSHSPDL